MKLPTPRLKAGAVPSVFHGCPSYFSSASSSREEPETKRLRLEMKHLERCIKESEEERRLSEEKVKFKDSCELHNKLGECDWLGNFSIVKRGDELLLCNITTDPFPEIRASVLVGNDLEVRSFLGTVSLKTVGKYKFPMYVNDMNVLKEILDGLNVLMGNRPKVEKSEMCLKLEVILSILDVMAADDEVGVKVNFIIEQLKLMMMNKFTYRYRSETLVFYCILFTISPHAYKFARNSGMFSLPHPTTIRQVCSSQKLSPVADLCNSLTYAKIVFPKLNSHERNVILMMDEIHLKTYVDYKGGNVVGFSHNSSSVAKTAHVFMISSLMSPFKEVVHILPVCNFSARELHDVTKKIIITLEGIGYRVVSIVSDNNAVNRKAVSMFAEPEKLSIVYPHPCDTTRPLFFVFDSVHLIKCVRNNWLNQSNGQSFLFPDLNDDRAPKLTASFQTIRELYFLECGEIVRFGHPLTLKALYPSNIERQNVKLALQVFNDYVVTALKTLGKDKNLKHHNETAEFVKIISDWWKVVNVKTPRKGIRLKDPLQTPMALDSEGRKVLEKVFDWVQRWDGTKGGLSKETHSAFMHTTHALCEMASYCTAELGMEFMLPGKVQTDSLEERFGLYRQLAGSNYHISIRQLYESETKLRLQNYLPLKLKSQSFKNILVDSVNDDDVDDVLEPKQSVDSFLHYNISVESDDIKNVSNALPVLTYIAGYCVRSYLKLINCPFCKIMLVKERMLEEVDSENLVKCLSRGGLFVPQEVALNAVVHVYVAMNKIISSDLEEEFLKEVSQRNVLHSISMNALILNDYLNDNICDNGHQMNNAIKKIVYVCANIFLKNYCCRKNDECCRVSNARKIMKFVK